MDASGVPPWGFINGNNFWLGGKNDCNYISKNYTLSLSEKIQKNNSLYRNSNEEYPPYELHFFAARMRHNSTVQYHIELSKEVSTRNLLIRIYIYWNLKFKIRKKEKSRKKIDLNKKKKMKIIDNWKKYN